MHSCPASRMSGRARSGRKGRPRLAASALLRTASQESTGRIALGSAYPIRSSTPRQERRAVRQLTALDQQFLALEDSRHVGHVGALAVLDPSTAPGRNGHAGGPAGADRRAAAAGPAVPVAAGRGAVRPRLRLLGRRRRLRPRLPRPRAGAAARRDRAQARRAGGADLRPSAGPVAPAVGAVPDPRAARRVASR